LAPDRATFKASDGTVFNFSDYNIKAWIYGHWHNHFYALLGKSGIKSYCTSTPDKGGIDHSPAVFRVFHINEQGEIRSETRYTHLQNQIEIAVPAQAHGAPIHTGRITTRVNVYHASSPTASVQAALLQPGQQPSWTPLARDTDFAWSGALEAKPGKQVLWVQATLENGNILNKKIEFIAATSSTTAKPDSEWSNLRGNAGHNLLVNKPASTNPALLWSANAGGNIFLTSPIVAEGKVFVATIDDDTATRCAVVAFDAATGKQLWKFKTGNSIKSSIAYDSGTVLAADAESRLYAIDATTGQEKWFKKLNVPFLPPLDQGLITENGIVYAGHQRGLDAVTVADGKPLWENQGRNGGEGTPATHTLGDGVLTVSSHWRGFYAHDAATGKPLWEQTGSELRFRDGPATFHDGKFYIASKDSLFVLDAKTGKILQSEKTSCSMSAGSAPLVTDKRIIVGTAEQGLVAFDRQTLKEAWRHTTDGALIYTVPYSNNHAASVESSPVLVGDTVYFGASDGSFYGVGLNDGRRRWAYKTGAPSFSSPAVSGNMLYMADFSGNLYAFLLK
jgi:outer membrane protein assembly factor BamB